VQPSGSSHVSASSSLVGVRSRPSSAAAGDDVVLTARNAMSLTAANPGRAREQCSRDRQRSVQYAEADQRPLTAYQQPAAGHAADLCIVSDEVALVPVLCSRDPSQIVSCTSIFHLFPARMSQLSPTRLDWISRCHWNTSGDTSLQRIAPRYRHASAGCYVIYYRSLCVRSIVADATRPHSDRTTRVGLVASQRPRRRNIPSSANLTDSATPLAHALSHSYSNMDG
jgi:hypothetical protein